MNTPEPHVMTVQPSHVLPGRAFAECTCGSMIGGTLTAVEAWMDTHENDTRGS